MPPAREAVSHLEDHSVEHGPEALHDVGRHEVRNVLLEVPLRVHLTDVTEKASEGEVR